MTTRDDLGKRIDSREYFSSNGISLFLLLLFSPATLPLLFLLPVQLAAPILAVATLLWFGVLALLSVRSYWFPGNQRVDIHDFGLVKMSGTQITEKVLYADMDQIKWQRRDRFVDGVYSETQLAFEFGTDPKHDSRYYFLHKDSEKFNAIWSLAGWQEHSRENLVQSAIHVPPLALPWPTATTASWMNVRNSST